MSETKPAEPAPKPEGEAKPAEPAPKPEGEAKPAPEPKDPTNSTPSTEGKSALDIIGVKIQPNSQCLPTDQRCIKRENEEAARKAMELAEKMKGIYQKDKKKAPVDSSGLECSMDGFNKMIKELTEVLFMLLAMVKEIALSMTPPEFAKAIKHAWDGMVGVQNWIGYFMAAFYFLGVEYDFGAGLCEFYGYGYYAIDYLHEAVNWAQSMGLDSSGGIDGLIGGLVKGVTGGANQAANGDTSGAASTVSDAAKAAAANAAAAATEQALMEAKAGEKQADKATQ